MLLCHDTWFTVTSLIVSVGVWLSTAEATLRGLKTRFPESTPFASLWSFITTMTCVACKTNKSNKHLHKTSHGLMINDSWKHPVKCFCLKCHIWWEINNLTSRLEFIAQDGHFIHFYFAIDACKICNRFVTILSWPRWPNHLMNFYRFFGLCIIWWITLSAYSAMTSSALCSVRSWN